MCVSGIKPSNDQRLADSAKIPNEGSVCTIIKPEAIVLEEPAGFDLLASVDIECVLHICRRSHQSQEAIVLSRLFP